MSGDWEQVLREVGWRQELRKLDEIDDEYAGLGETTRERVPIRLWRALR